MMAIGGLDLDGRGIGLATSGLDYIRGTWL